MNGLLLLAILLGLVAVFVLPPVGVVIVAGLLWTIYGVSTHVDRPMDEGEDDGDF